MNINEASQTPIFLQIAEGIEDGILSGAFPEQSQIPSITEFSVTYKINPATALKGINLLVDEGILHKKRGVGMFVSDNACARLREKRKDSFYDGYIKGLVTEASRLGITMEEVSGMLAKGFSDPDAGGRTEK